SSQDLAQFGAQTAGATQLVNAYMAVEHAGTQASTDLRAKYDKAINDNVRSLADFIQQGGTSKQILDAYNATQGATVEGAARLTAQLAQATSAFEQWDAAVRNFKMPKLNTDVATLDKLRAGINAQAEDLTKNGKTVAEVLNALKPALENYRKATID